MRGSKLIVIILGAALSCGLALGQGKKNGAKGAGDAAKGKEIFEQCSVCHNADSTEKKLGPGLKGLFKLEKMANGKAPTEANVQAKIDEGGGGMPAYKDMLSAEEKANLMAYLKTL
jgi:cytochrome c